MSLKLILFVALGGAIGAVARHVSMSAIGHWPEHGFPWGTLFVNVAGSFILGALIESFALAWTPDDAVRAMVVVGILGAFTTFSAFSLDVQALMARGHFLAAGGYVTGSVVVSVGALFAGMALFRHVWA